MSCCEAAAEPGTRVIAIASPNDPTGELLATAELERLLAGLPDDVAVLLDESLVEFSDAQPVNSSLALRRSTRGCSSCAASPRPGAWPGLRVGYAIGGPGSEELLAELQPDLGVSEVSQAGALEALRSCSEIVARRVAAVSRERTAVTAGLRERGFDVADSQANFVWAAHPAIEGGELSARLARAGILVAGGAALGSPTTCASPCATPAPAHACWTRSTSRCRENVVPVRTCADRRRAACGSTGRRRMRRRTGRACAPRTSQPARPDWRNSAPVVPSRILRHAPTCSGSTSSKCATTAAQPLPGDVQPVALGDFADSARIRPRDAA